jgi:hypothetical protein
MNKVKLVVGFHLPYSDFSVYSRMYSTYSLGGGGYYYTL